MNKMIVLQEQIQQASKYLEFYKKQASILDKELSKADGNAALDGSFIGGRGEDKSYHYSVEQEKIKLDNEMKEQIAKMKRKINAMQKSKQSFKTVNELTQLRNLKQIQQLENLITN